MPDTLTVIIIACVLLAVIAATIIKQLVDRNRQQKQRIISALRKRGRNFKYLLEGFPPNFLGPELKLLVLKCILEVYQKLSHLEPDNEQHLDEIQHVTTAIEETKRRQQPARRQPLKSAQEIKEVKRYLEELQKFVHRLHQRGSIDKKQVASYEAQIKSLINNASLDTYLNAANQSKQQNKPKLAIHFFKLAIKSLEQDNKDMRHTDQILQLKTTIQELMEQADIEEAPTPEASGDNANTAWDKFGKDEEDPWKKKNVYD